MRIAELLHDAAMKLEAVSIDDARLEADVLLAQVLGIDRAHLLARMDDAVDEDARSRFAALLARRLRHEPLAYVVGRREFYGIDIECAPGALIPRPESEMLVAIALDEVMRRGSGLRIVDVGTGSGAIAVAIAANAPGARVTAIDASDAALSVAGRNVDRAGVANRVDLRVGDVLDGQGAFDVIVANLPYVRAADWEALAPEIREFEPREALVGGARGTEAIERLLRQAAAHLARGGVLAAEIGDSQGAWLTAAARDCFPDDEACVIKDLAGLDRVLVIRLKGG
jgi:release factor glutamine methyltransferase